MTEQTTVDTAAETAAVSNLRIMDKELYDKIHAMLSSSDKEHWPIAEDILFTVDMEKSIYWMWKLSRAHWWRFNRRRKAVREKLVQHPLLGRVAVKGEYFFAEYLVNNGLMTEEIWSYLYPSIKQTVETKSKNVFFDIEFKMKKLW
jgi:hypothetical protein